MSTTQHIAPRLPPPSEQAKRQFGLPKGARRLIAAEGISGLDSCDPLDNCDQLDHESLAHWLASDHGLAQRLLRWCNAPFYNLSRPYRSLQEAAQVMDPSDLSRLAVLAHVREFFLPDLQVDIYQRHALWRHSIAVGAVASMISRTCSCGDPGVVFVAGTLHDIGLCISERLDIDSFTAMVAEVDELTPTCEIEREMQGWDHTELGAAVLEQWAMPLEVQMAARRHHLSEEATAGSYGETVGCVSIANYLCSRSGWPSLGSHNVAAPSDETFQCLGIDTNLLTVLWQQLHPALQSVAEMV